MTSLSISSSSLEQTLLLLQQEQSITTNGNRTNTTTVDLGIIQDNASSSSTTSNGNGSSLTNNSNLSVDVLAVLVQSQTTLTYPTTQVSDSHGQSSPFHVAFHKLVEALKSGSLTDAQSAYANLLQVEANSASTSNGDTTNLQGQQTFQQALSQIGTDLQQNDLSGAQQVLSQLHHHDDHHPDDGQDGVRGLLRKILSILNRLTNGKTTDEQSTNSQTASGTQINANSNFTLAIVDNSSSTQLTTTGTSSTLTTTNSTTGLIIIGATTFTSTEANNAISLLSNLLSPQKQTLTGVA